MHDELLSGRLVRVGRSSQLKENFYAVTTLHRHRIERLELLMARCVLLRSGRAWKTGIGRTETLAYPACAAAAPTRQHAADMTVNCNLMGNQAARPAAG